MRIANKPFFLKQFVTVISMAMLGGALLLPSAVAHATEVPLAASMPVMPAVPPQAEPVKTPGADMGKNLSTMEEKISENAKSVEKRLDTTSDTVTLDDLNSARQTVARIEAMIDVEKHMAELDKLRNERSGHMNSAVSLAGAIPASALIPPISQINRPFIPVTVPREAEHRSGGSGGTDISRITGADGKYAAVLKLASGETRTVKVGDEIFGGTVQSITSSSVEIKENGETRTLHVKNVDMVYSALR